MIGGELYELTAHNASAAHEPPPRSVQISLTICGRFEEGVKPVLNRDGNIPLTQSTNALVIGVVVCCRPVEVKFSRPLLCSSENPKLEIPQKTRFD